MLDPTVLLLLVGLLAAFAAGVVGWLLGAARRAAALQPTTTEHLARIAALESERDALQARVGLAEQLSQQAGQRLLAETGARTGAEATAYQMQAQLEGLRAELAARDGQLETLRTEARGLAEARQQLATRLETQEHALAEQRVLLEGAQAKLSDAFRALASESLRANNQQFIELARVQFEGLQAAARGDLEKRERSIQQLVEPVRESLEKVQNRIGEVEKERVGAYQSLLTQVSSLAQTQAELRRETGNLVGALRRPSVRGRWGEVQLKRVVEMAGMLDHVDFVEQPSVSGEDGELRPDLVVRLPGEKCLVVDAKAPLEAYLDSLELADEAACRAKLVDHARQIRDHVGRLSRKQYWNQFANTPDFVVLFIPGEMFFSAALEQDPSLIESSVREKVILATPTTLIALLRTVAYAWRQEALAEDARRIGELGRELYDRLQTVASHWAGMGQGLRRAVACYNDAVGSLDGRLMPTARRFRELNLGGEAKEVELKPIEAVLREVQSEELREPELADARAARVLEGRDAPADEPRTPPQLSVVPPRDGTED